MKKVLFAIALTAAMTHGAAAEISAESSSDIQKEMLSTFCGYAAVNSQSAYPDDGTRTFTMTDGQRRMAALLKKDAEAIAAVNPRAGIEVYLSDDCYLYVTVAATKGVKAPTLGISCHLDVTPEVDFGGGDIRPVVDTLGGHTIVRTDGTTLLGADDKTGCTIAMTLLRKLAFDSTLRHGKVIFAFCPNEDVGMAAERIDKDIFNPDILFDIDGEEPYCITDSNFTARSFNILFKGKEAHPSDAKALGMGDALAAAAIFIATIPESVRPEHTEGKQGYIHPFNISKKGADVLVECRIRYFDAGEGQLFDGMLKHAVGKAIYSNPNVGYEVVSEDLQYENVEYTLHPEARSLVEKASAATGIPVSFISSRGGTTASMFAAKGLKGGMCIFSGQHNAHSLKEYADLQEMEDAYRLLLNIATSL